MKILTQQQDSPVLSKTRELCQTILDQAAYRNLRAAIDGFLNHEASVAQYRELCDLQDTLASKQEHNMPLPDDEVAAFEKAEQAFLQNPVAQSFIDAQQQMQKIEQTVARYVRKTFELGRVPADDEVGGGGCGSGGCGGGCGCS